VREGRGGGEGQDEGADGEKAQGRGESGKEGVSPAVHPQFGGLFTSTAAALWLIQVRVEVYSYDGPKVGRRGEGGKCASWAGGHAVRSQ
jgi:hypothetical protein